VVSKVWQNFSNFVRIYTFSKQFQIFPIILTHILKIRPKEKAWVLAKSAHHNNKV
jgi:hypothetical protein